MALSGHPAQWTRVDSFRIKNLLAFSFQAIFLSLVPVLLKLFAISDRAMWQLSLAVLSFGTISVTLFAFAGFRRLTQPERAVLRPLFVYSIMAVLSTVAIVELSFAFWGSVAAAPGMFFTGLVTLLAVAVYLIVRFLFARPAA